MVIRALLFLLLLTACASAQEQGMNTAPAAPSVNSNPPAGFAGISNIFSMDVTTNFGTVITLNGLTGTATVTGLQVTDGVMVNCLGALPAGVSISTARVSAANTLEVKFQTAVLGNVSLGSLVYRVIVFRP